MRLIDADKLSDYFYYGQNDETIINPLADRVIVGIITKQPTISTEDIRREIGKELLETLDSKYQNNRGFAYYWLKSQIEHICFGVKRICDIIAEKTDLWEEEDG